MQTNNNQLDKDNSLKAPRANKTSKSKEEDNTKQQ